MTVNEELKQVRRQEYLFKRNDIHLKRQTLEVDLERKFSEELWAIRLREIEELNKLAKEYGDVLE